MLKTIKTGFYNGAIGTFCNLAYCCIFQNRNAVLIDRYLLLQQG